MKSSRKEVYSDDLLNITESFLGNLKDVEDKIGDDYLINKGLFVMVTAFFEDSIRELMKVVLVSFPEKLPKTSCTVSREQLCSVADKGHSVIIDNELFYLFKDGVRSQLENLFKILFNKEYKKGNKKSLKNAINEREKESIIKLEEISLYRNALVHNGGKVDVDINERVRHFKPSTKKDIIFDSYLIKDFIREYENFFGYLNNLIRVSYSSYLHMSNIEKTKNLWEECFSSPILQFEDYWKIDEERDLITGIKYPEIERDISSSEKVLLSIWRHQYYDPIKTEEFLLCSVNYHKIYELYKGLDDLKFYYMKQKADEIN